MLVILILLLYTYLSNWNLHLIQNINVQMNDFELTVPNL